MTRRTLLVAAALAGCKPSDQTRLRVIIGAVLIDGSGEPPVSRSVVVVAGSRIRAVGAQANTPVPAGSEKYDGTGKFVVPALIEIAADAAPAIQTLAQARERVDAGASALGGMIADTEDIDPGFLVRLRNLQVVFLPRLHQLGDAATLARAQRNTKRLAEAGVPIAAGDGEGAAREWELLTAAGLSPMEVLVAATHHAARVGKPKQETGILQPGKSADLLLLDSNPLEDPRNLGRVERRMIGGEWIQEPR